MIGPQPYKFAKAEQTAKSIAFDQSILGYYLYYAKQQAKQMLGQSPKASITAWGNLPEYDAFLSEIGFPSAIDEIAFDADRRADATPCLSLIKTGHYRLLLGYKHIDNIKYLLHDDLIRSLLGYQKAIVPKTLTNFLRDACVEKFQKLHNWAVKKSQELGCSDNQGIYAIDLSDIMVYGEYFEQSAPLKNGGGKVGYRLACLMRLGKYPIIVAAGIVPGFTDERDMVFPLLDYAISFLGKEAIKIVLFDRGFSDGQLFFRLKSEYGIDWITPAKDASYIDSAIKSLQENDFHPTADKHLSVATLLTDAVPNCPMRVTLMLFRDNRKKPPKNLPEPKTVDEKLLRIPGKHLKALLRLEGEKTTGNKTLLVERIIKEIAPAKISLCLDLFFTPKRKPIVEDKSLDGYITSLLGVAAYPTLLKYRSRWQIENNGFKVLKEAIFVDTLPNFSFQAIQNHVLLCSLTFNLWTIFKESMGEQTRIMSISRMRSEYFSAHQIFIQTAESQVLVGIELIMQLLWQQKVIIIELIQKLGELSPNGWNGT